MKLNSTNFYKTLMLVFAAFIVMTGSGCSYVSDMVEGALTNRASFSIDATYSSPNMTITWNETGGSNFAGYEIYRTINANDEYSGYTLVASKWFNNTSNDLASISTQSYTYNASALAGSSNTYFYRVGIIVWDEDTSDRTTANGYPVNYPTFGWNSETSYNNNTDVDEISGAAMVVIP